MFETKNKKKIKEKVTKSLVTMFTSDHQIKQRHTFWGDVKSIQSFKKAELYIWQNPNYGTQTNESHTVHLKKKSCIIVYIT